MSRWRRTALAVCALVALTACKVDVTVHVQVNDNGSGRVTVTAIADAELLERAPGLAEDLNFADAAAAGWLVDGPLATDDGGLRVVISHDFATVEEATALLQSINGAGGPLHDTVITRTEDDSQVVTSLVGMLRVDGGLEAFADSDLLTAIGGSPYAAALGEDGLQPTDAVSFTLTADFPGEVRAGGTGNSSLTWTVPIDGTGADLATSSVLAKGGSGIWSVVSTVAFVALIAWILVAVAFIAFVVRARRRRARAAQNTYRPRPLTRL